MVGIIVFCGVDFIILKDGVFVMVGKFFVENF